MYYKKNLYYLNQMGIFPWVTKKNTQNSEHLPNSVNSSTKIILIGSAKAQTDACSFLNQVTYYLKSIDDSLLVKFCDTLEQATLSVETLMPAVVLLFDLVGPINTNKTMPHIVYYKTASMLAHSSAKKQLLSDIESIKKIISAT